MSSNKEHRKRKKKKSARKLRQASSKRMPPASSAADLRDLEMIERKVLKTDPINVDPSSTVRRQKSARNQQPKNGKQKSNSSMNYNKPSDAKDDNSECPICQDKLSLLFDCGVLDGCPHLMHYTCLKEWAKQKKTCPMCRMHFTEIKEISLPKELNPVNNKAGARMPPEYKFLWKILQNFRFNEDFISFVAKQQKVSSSVSKLRCKEYKKYLLLIAVCSTPTSPPDLLAEIWQYHLASPQNYSSMCESVFKGIAVAWAHPWVNSPEKPNPCFDPSFHIPPAAFRSGVGSEKAHKAMKSRYATTLSLYKRIFGSPKDSLTWVPLDKYVDYVALQNTVDLTQTYTTIEVDDEFEEGETDVRHADDENSPAVRQKWGFIILGVMLVAAGAFLVINFVSGSSNDKQQ